MAEPDRITSEVEKWSTRGGTCSLAVIPLSIALIVLGAAGRDAAMWTMIGLLTSLIVCQVYCLWRRWSASRVSSTS
ncbi:hypothetical protein N7445_008391 [Penicillium cf. griseofulvum]|nr:hypothetical protein N7445_008391 [Penicillium cf. griseofulvum]